MVTKSILSWVKWCYDGYSSDILVMAFLIGKAKRTEHKTVKKKTLEKSDLNSLCFYSLANIRIKKVKPEIMLWNVKFSS